MCRNQIPALANFHTPVRSKAERSEQELCSPTEHRQGRLLTAYIRDTKNLASGRPVENLYRTWHPKTTPAQAKIYERSPYLSQNSKTASRLFSLYAHQTPANIAPTKAQLAVSVG